MASAAISLTVAAIDATSVTYTPPGALTGPLVAGYNLGPIVVGPPGWIGTLSLTGTDAAKFTISANNNLIVGPAALAAGSYSFSIVATP